MSQHTPGPWSAVPIGRRGQRRSNGEKVHLHAIVPPDQNRHGRIANVIGSEPNARLIAAAPDLLAALESMLASGRLQQPERDQARAAIRKTTGE